jgi:hypothetical protein
MSASKRPSTSSLRRFITSRPYVTVADIRRRFTIDDPDAMACLQRNGSSAWIGLPEREATKLQELWQRDELGLQMSVEVRAPVVVGVYPMRIARYVIDAAALGAAPSNGTHSHVAPRPHLNGNGAATPPSRQDPTLAPEPAGGAPERLPAAEPLPRPAE